VNSRVFDALATGTLVVSDNEEGVRELFDDDFPTWHDAASLRATVDGLLADDARRADLAARYRQVVLECHTYAKRAEQIRSALISWVEARRFALHIGPQNWEMAANWGDTPFGRAVQRQIERRDHPASLLVFDERDSLAARRSDVALHIFGVRAPVPRPGQINLLWVISHPDRVTAELCASYAVIFVASDIFLEHLRSRVDQPLVALHQATDPDRFYPDPTGPTHELLFVGNSRGVRRRIIDDLRETPFDLAVYGGNWTEDLLDLRRLKGEWIPNAELRRYYSSATIVLCDHWEDMRDEGFASNRLYDALASGAFIISDRLPGLDEEFDNGVVTYERRDELIAKIERYLADPDARREVAGRGRAAVVTRHTFAHRVSTMLETIGPRLQEERSGISEERAPTSRSHD
jgi:O-antigen biosynthesis protein